MSHPNSPFGNFHLRTEIPYFCGEYVDWWIYHIECFFQKRGTIPEMKTRVAEVYMVGEALHWYKEWDWKARWSWQKITWETFVEDLKNRFKPPEIVKSEVLRSILMDIEKVKQLIVEMRAQNLAYMTSLSELKHYSSTISRVQVTESKAAEDEQFDSKQIILVKPDLVISDSQEITATTQLSVCTHEGDNALVKDCIPSLRPMLYEPPEVSTEVYSHHLPLITLHADVELVTDMGCLESENVTSPVVLGTSSLCCTAGVCQNVYESFCYSKIICHQFQSQNIHEVVNDVLFPSAWDEKPPPFPPDITPDAILFQRPHALGEKDHVLELMRFAEISVVLCLKEFITSSITRGILSLLWLVHNCAQMPIMTFANEKTKRMKTALLQYERSAYGSHLMDSVGYFLWQCTMVSVKHARRDVLNLFYGLDGSVSLEFLKEIIWLQNTAQMLTIDGSDSENIMFSPLSQMEVKLVHLHIAFLFTKVTWRLGWYFECLSNHSSFIIEDWCSRHQIFELGNDQLEFLRTQQSIVQRCDRFGPFFFPHFLAPSNYQIGKKCQPSSVFTLRFLIPEWYTLILHVYKSVDYIHRVRGQLLRLLDILFGLFICGFKGGTCIYLYVLMSKVSEPIVFLGVYFKLPTSLVVDHLNIYMIPTRYETNVDALWYSMDDGVRLELLKEIQLLVNTGVVKSLLSKVHFCISQQLQGAALVFCEFMLKNVSFHQHVATETKINSCLHFTWEGRFSQKCESLFAAAIGITYFSCDLKPHKQVSLATQIHTRKQVTISLLFQLMGRWILQSFGHLTSSFTLLIINGIMIYDYVVTGQYTEHMTREQLKWENTEFYIPSNNVIKVRNAQQVLFIFNSSKGVHVSLWKLCDNVFSKLQHKGTFGISQLTPLTQKRIIQFKNLSAATIEFVELKHLVAAMKTPYSDVVQLDPSLQGIRIFRHCLKVQDILRLLPSEYQLIDKEPYKINEDGLELFRMHVISIPTQRGWYQYLKCSLLVALLVLSSFIIEPFAFSLPRPPENTDLEDKFILKGGGIDTIITTDWIDYVLITRTFLE